MYRRSIFRLCSGGPLNSSGSSVGAREELYRRYGGVLNYADIADKMSVPENYVRLLVSKNKHNLYTKQKPYPAQLARTSKPNERASKPEVMFPLYQPKKDVAKMLHLRSGDVSTQ